MRLLDRYLLREFLIPLGYCLVGFLIFWIAFDLFSELHGMQEKHLRAADIAAYYVFKIPEFLPIALPVALLLGLLYALTGHARCNELTAIRASGVSLWRLCAPYLAVGFAASLLLFALNEFCAPVATDMAESILDRRTQRQLTPGERQQIRNPPLIVNSLQRRVWHMSLFNETTGQMIRPHVEWNLPNGSLLYIDADQAVRSNAIWVFEGNVQRLVKSNAYPMRLPPVSRLPMPEFHETPEEIKSQLNILQNFGQASRTHKADVPIRMILDCWRLFPNPEPSMRSWLATKFQGRFAGPFTCLVVILIGVPFGAATGRRSVFVGVAASISIFFVYYVLQQLGFALGEAGRMAPWAAAWLPNIAFGIAGLYMMLRAR